jgi:polyhydroxyalkanoate synthesis repressor PhaR
LDDLRQLVAAGEKIKVIDDKSGDDLTRSVLLQIIAEQEQFGVPVLNCDLLEMVIRFYGGPMQGLLSRYLEQAFTTMLRQQEAMQSEMTKALQTPFAPLTELVRKNMEAWEQMQAATRDAFVGRSRPTSSKTQDKSDKPQGANKPQGADEPQGADKPQGANKPQGADKPQGDENKGE